ncbi:hypothetical protein LCGC14_1737720, partial [marine sediment metagenome]
MDPYDKSHEKEKEFLQENASFFTNAKNAHYQRCHLCSRPLTALEDYYGAGSHYWILACGKCFIRFTYDTYEFKLRTYPK